MPISRQGLVALWSSSLPPAELSKLTKENPASFEDDVGESSWTPASRCSRRHAMRRRSCVERRSPIAAPPYRRFSKCETDPIELGRSFRLRSR
jgi:hypothetical protein